ncbi:TMV resistance protein N-like isoform X2 [Abrus precatorius]|uniref:TMV resistance protein N-like isoform X2 n=1 Tax=Abrus precatorius TaxID=3816 RepID=A0A8B8KR93_ABRPR|nr:TMV resistance protein N-like isoform X2 [Abrus precatorius]
MASNSIIPYTSSSSSSHEVFVSFRGDIRNNFADHLFGGLGRKGIRFFRDDSKLEKGKLILPELLQAIDGSHILVVVFSEEYASSKWCLRELERIADYVDDRGKHVLPVFYRVDPSDVRKQSGQYKKAFDEYKQIFKEDEEKMEEVQRWREALARVGNLSGWHITNESEHSMIEIIVKDILKKLSQSISILPNQDLVGMESRVEEIEKLLCLDSVNDVGVVGICGMPGIGKTTLGRALYKTIFRQYDFHCYIDDVSKIFRDFSTLGLLKQLLRQILNDRSLEIYNVSAGTDLVQRRLRHARALIILDNVDNIDQLYQLALKPNQLCAGTRIIIISSDEHILRAYKVNRVYRVQPLTRDNAIQLFCKYAFEDNYIMSMFEELKYDVLSYADGHPLAIKVLGSFLFGQDVSQWRRALAMLRESPDEDVMKVLRISFDGLKPIQKEIFLDIACFFSDDFEKDYVEEVLNFRGYYPEINLSVLVQKSLITIEEGRIYMPTLLSDLGRCIVREKSPKKPRKWSRLWDYQDLRKVMLDHKAAKNLEAIEVYGDDEFDYQETTITADALSKMRHLKLLEFRNVNFSGRLDFLSNELGYLTWWKYPFDYLPSNFQPDNLVELILRDSNIKQLWKDTKPLPNLRRLDLSYSQSLIELPHFGEAPKLEWLNLEGCTQLSEIQASIGLLRRLTFLNLRNCTNLVSVHCSIWGLNTLEYLTLSCCSKLCKLLDEPRDGEHLKKRCIGEAPVHSQSASSIGNLLQEALYSISCLRQLDLSCCSLLQIPVTVGNLHCLEWLNLRGNKFGTLPSLKELSRLYYINLEHCKQLKCLPELPSRTHFSSQTFRSPFPKSVLLEHKEVAVLNIFDCPELADRERCNRMCFSWMMQIVKVGWILVLKVLFQEAKYQGGSTIRMWAWAI